MRAPNCDRAIALVPDAPSQNQAARCGLPERCLRLRPLIQPPASRRSGQATAGPGGEHESVRVGVLPRWGCHGLALPEFFCLLASLVPQEANVVYKRQNDRADTIKSVWRWL